MNGIFRIDTAGVDVAGVLAEIRQRVEEKRRTGIPDIPRQSAGATPQTANLETGDEVINFYLQTISDAARVDINDFEIPGRETFLGRAEVGLKKVIWKLLKFYTFRLFSQQNDFNGRVALILQGMDRKLSRRLEKLDQELLLLEEKRRG